MRINVIEKLTLFDNSIKWETRVKSYNKKHNKFIEVENGVFLSTIENLIDYVEVSRLKREHRHELLAELYKERTKQLQDELNKRPKHQKANISEVLTAYDVKSENDMINRFILEMDKKKDDDFQGIFSILHTYYFYISPYITYNSMHTRFTRFRNAVRERKYSETKETFILKYLVLPKIVTDSLENAYNEQINEKNKDLNSLITISAKQAKQLLNELETEIFSNAFENLTKQQKIARLYFYIHLGTGRRPIEIYKNGSFTAVQNNNNMIFKGQAKTRSKIEVIYEFPCLFSKNTKMVQAIDIFRKLLGRFATDINGHKKISKWLIVGGWNDLIKKININPNTIIFYDLRALYSHLANVTLNDNMESRTYIAHILGHKFDFTSKSYTKFKISN